MSNEHSIEGLGEVPRDWSIAPLGDFVEYVTYGFTNPMPDSEVGPFKLTAKDVNGGRILYESARRTTWDAYNELLTNKSRPAKGDVLLTKDGSIGRVAIVDRDDVCINQSVAVMRPKVTTDARFLSYLLQTPYYQDRMSADSDGSTIKHIYITRVDKMGIAAPELGEQRAIAAVLGALDDKIEQNRRTGRALEGLARATFKAWFVDCEPVKAKAAGQTSFPGMPFAAFAALPDRLTDSPLGPVPQGWTPSTIKDRTSAIQYGLTTSASPDPVGPRFLRITDIRGGTVDWNKVPYCHASTADAAKYRIQDGDILVARTGASTGENLYVVEPPEAVFASYLVRFQFPDRGIARIVGEFMRTQNYQSFVKGTLGGSAQPNANAQMLAAAEMVFPAPGIAAAFYEVVRPLDLMRSSGARESAKLATLRDYLLPGLLSGRVRVRDFDQAGKAL